jgi:hypothetical protein
MNIQSIIVGFIILLAAIYAGMIVWRKSRSFSTKSGCEADCGCNGKAKKLTS